MTTEELKKSALRNLLEEHLWKVGESDTFTLGGPNGPIVYRMERTDYGWALQYGSERSERRNVEAFPTMGRLYNHIFRGLGIAY